MDTLGQLWASCFQWLAIKPYGFNRYSFCRESVREWLSINMVMVPGFLMTLAVDFGRSEDYSSDFCSASSLAMFGSLVQESQALKWRSSRDIHTKLLRGYQQSRLFREKNSGITSLLEG